MQTVGTKRRAGRLLRHRRARRLRIGVTLVEVLIVVAIMALIAGGASFLILPRWKESQVKTATTTARNIRAVTIQYVALKSGGDCPTVQSLIAAKELDSAGDTEDPWGQPYNIICENDDITVTSSGPDKKEGTEDDIVVGPAAQG
jgi:general secretion pathway protein G